MAKIGRNEPCPCGSGKKYKQCCLARDEAAERQRPPERSTLQGHPQLSYVRLQELNRASDAVVQMVDAGKLDEAEHAAVDLIGRFPHLHDGYHRLGMVHQARGDHLKAAECYRKAVAIIREHPDDYDPGFEATFQTLADRLDPSTTEG